MKLIDKLKRYRDRNDMTQTQLSEKLGISVPFTSRCMAEKQKLPMMTVLELRGLGGITIADIMDYLTAKIKK